ncbi:putative CCHC-type domain-containing protein [Seiridium cardinale]
MNAIRLDSHLRDTKASVQVYVITVYGPLQVGFDTLDGSQKAVYRSLDSLPHGLAPVVGTASCGKTMFLAYIAQMLLYNDPDQKILVIYPDNAAVDDFPAKFVSVCQKMGVRDEEIATPLRAYAFPSETEAGVRFVRKMGNHNDNNDAEAGLDAGLSEQDPFLATFVVQSTIKDSSGKRPARKNFDKAYAYFDKGRRVSDLRMREAKSGIKQILADNLSKERIVCATACAARETKFRESFKPTAVFQDGNGRARELTTIPHFEALRAFWRPEDLMEISLAAAAQNKNSSCLSGLTSIQHNNHAATTPATRLESGEVHPQVPALPTIGSSGSYYAQMFCKELNNRKCFRAESKLRDTGQGDPEVSEQRMDTYLLHTKPAGMELCRVA